MRDVHQLWISRHDGGHGHETKCRLEAPFAIDRYEVKRLHQLVTYRLHVIKNCRVQIRRMIMTDIAADIDLQQRLHKAWNCLDMIVTPRKRKLASCMLGRSTHGHSGNAPYQRLWFGTYQAFVAACIDVIRQVLVTCTTHDPGRWTTNVLHA